MSKYHPGGFVNGPPVEVTLDPDECVLDRDLRCQRTDVAHHFQMIEAPRHIGDYSGTVIPGRCLHRHPIPVESGGKVVAHLCPACDDQLP